MADGTFFRGMAAGILVIAMTFAAVGGTPSRAQAQCMGTACTTVHPDGKGIIGLGLIGAEIGLFIPAIVQNAAHTNEWWPYLVFPLLGAAGGAVGGYFLEQATQSSPEVDVGIFVGALVLTVPTIIGTLALAQWSPPAESVTGDEDMYDEASDTSDEDSVEATQDGGGDDTSAAPDDGGSSTDTTTTPPQSMLTPAGGRGLVRFDADTRQVLLGVPVIGSLATYTQEEVASLHVTQTYDVHIPVVSASF